MLNINGFELKAVKNYKGHDGQPLAQGNLYYNNKKVGFLSDSDRGGPVIIRIKDDDIEEKFNETAKQFKGDKASTLNAKQFLYYHLFHIKDIEKTVKKKAKKHNMNVEDFKIIFLIPKETDYFGEEQVGLFDAERYYIVPINYDDSDIIKKEKDEHKIVTIEVSDLLDGLETYEI